MRTRKEKAQQDTHQYTSIDNIEKELYYSITINRAYRASYKNIKLAGFTACRLFLFAYDLRPPPPIQAKAKPPDQTHTAIYNPSKPLQAK